MNWSDKAVVDALREAASEGLSGTQIAGRLYRKFGFACSRSAVIGKLHRLGLRLTGDPADPKPVIYHNRKRTSFKRKTMTDGSRGFVLPTPHGPPTPRKDPVIVDMTDDHDIPLSQRKSLMDLETHHCRWPIGDPGDRDFSFCGADKVHGLPYCEGHALRAYDSTMVAVRLKSNETQPNHTKPAAAKAKTESEMA